MNWADLVVLIIIIGIVGAEVKRGFGTALFTLLGAVGAMKLASLWAGPLAKSVHLKAEPGPNEALVLFVLFILLLAVTQGIAYVVHPDTFLNLDPFDNFAGGLCGLATGWVVASLFYSGLLTWGAADLVRSSALAPEILEFRTYHNVLRGMRGLGAMGKNRYGQ